MKKRFLWLLMGTLLMFVLGACGEKKETIALATGPIEATLDVSNTADPGEEVRLAVRVTQTGEAVTDADEVEFEVWQDGEKTGSRLVVAKHVEGGVYEASTVFDEPGTYVVQVHVTARNMHTMPTTNVQVGDEPSEEAAEHEDPGHGHASEVAIHLDGPKSVRAGMSAEFAVDVTLGGEVLSGAEVQLEISSEGNEKHEWLTLTEQNGRYVGVYSFPLADAYTLQVHVTKKDEVHDHIVEMIEVN